MPVKLFSLNWSVFKRWSRPNDSGISPAKPQDTNESLVSVVIFPTDGGISPERLFLDKARSSSLESCPSSVGMGPEIRFLMR